MIEALSGFVVLQRLREDGQFVLLRARRLADDAPVLLLGARDGRRDSRERIEREFALRAELDPGFAAMPLALADSHSGHVLVLDDCGAAPLSTLPCVAMTPRAFLPLAVNIARALAQLHMRNLVHKDLRPEHILLEPSSGRVLLTGFGSAARLGAVPRGPDGYQSGSLPYMAPEQTGRVNRPVDTRTDLYALGVMLYQLLCGQLPFVAADPMQWIYSHVARPPQPCGADIDSCCASIVMKLLAKAPEHRYQSAAGLQADLAHCLAMLQADEPVRPFPLGCSDGAERAQAVGTLVGREAELDMLRTALSCPAGGMLTEPVLIAGPGGSGKSALLAAFSGHAAAAGATAMTIKFEQHLSGIPYAALRAGFQMPPAARARLGADAGLLAHVFPQLGRAARDTLGEAQARVRLQAAFRRLVALCASEAAPLVLCFDDLQWADPASALLMEELLLPSALPHVLLVGAVRGQAGSLPLMRAIDEMAGRGMRARLVPVEPLARAETGELVAAALNCTRTLCAPLADLVHARSGGNPMFSMQLLTRFAEAGLLRHGGDDGSWQWDGAALAACQGISTLSGLLATRLQQLPYSALEVLKLLACLGQQASVATLARVSGMSEAEVDESLWPAARLGLLRRSPGQYSFQHDLVRQSAAALLGRRGLPERNLHIGRVLAHGARGDAVFAAAAHMNRGQAAMGESEIRSLVRINAAAGKRARVALAFDAARSYYAAAVALDAEAGWRTQPQRTLALHLALADCEQHCGDLESAAQRLAQLDARAAGLDAGRLARAAVALRRVAVSQALGRHEQAAELALEALSWFGLEFPDDEAALVAALEQERAAIDTVQPSEAAADPDAAMVTALCAEMGPALCARRPHLYRLLAARALHLVLRHGSSDASCTIYSRYAVVLASMGEVEQAFSYADKARTAASSALRRARMDFVHAAFLHHWRAPLGSTVPELDAAASACQELGDLAHAGYAAHVSLWHSYEAGHALPLIATRAQGYERLSRRQGGGPLLKLLQCHAALVEALRGEGGVQAGRRALSQMQVAGDGVTRTGALVLRQATAYMFGLYEEALEAAGQVNSERNPVTGAVHEGSHRYFHALTLAALHGEASAAQRSAMVEAVRASEAQLRQQAMCCPANFSGRHLLVAAELARMEDRDMDAMRSYDAAIALARAAGLQHHEALAADLGADFYASRGFDTSAIAYAREAWAAWGRWGAHARQRSLERRFPALSGHGASGWGAPDTEAAFAACKALAAVRDMRTLADVLLSSAVSAGGASRALLLVPGDSGLRAVAEATPGASGVQVMHMNAPLAALQVPLVLPSAALESRCTQVIDDALTHPQLSMDPVVEQRRLRALLCVPLSSQGMTIGLLYLEHALVAGVFDIQRRMLLELVASQAALVLDRERLVAALDLEWLRRRVADEGQETARPHSVVLPVACRSEKPVSLMQINPR